MLYLFQSTRPTRGATSPLPLHRWSRRGSIHAPHEGRDASVSACDACYTCFNPRAPRGARPRHFHFIAGHGGVQSTRPTRGATRPLVLVTHVILVSIHAPHEGRDLATSTSSLVTAGFNPRAPRGARRVR